MFCWERWKVWQKWIMFHVNDTAVQQWYFWNLNYHYIFQIRWRVPFNVSVKTIWWTEITCCFANWGQWSHNCFLQSWQMIYVHRRSFQLMMLGKLLLSQKRWFFTQTCSPFCVNICFQKASRIIVNRQHKSLYMRLSFCLFVFLSFCLFVFAHKQIWWR